MGATLRLRVLPGRLSVCRLPPGAPFDPSALFSRAPATGAGPAILSVALSAEELSVVCAEGAEPAGARVESGWRTLKVQGPLDFGLTGVLAAIASPLAAAGIPIFALSTFDTDYVLVKEPLLPAAAGALRGAGMDVEG
ncbi:MAG TPA: ACT domain-containing protein [Spirochaetales bacterium]|nr:ACT domain-containing protein [Spirochaetales bacterium]